MGPWKEELLRTSTNRTLLQHVGADMAQYKRRLIPIVDRKFQFKYTGLIAVIAAVIASVWAIFSSTPTKR